MSTENRRLHSGRPIGGVILIIAGLALLLNALDLFHIGPFISRYWPGVFILVGISRLSQRGSNSAINGYFWIVIGILGIAVRVGLIEVSIFRLIGPVILIWVGVLVLTRRPWGGFQAGKGVDSSDRVEANTVLGGVNRICTSQQFRGGEINSIMGGFKIDLREANMPPGEAVLEINVIMGGVELLLPQDWAVDGRVDPILGGYEDSTRPPKDAVKRLVIEGSIIMGGCTVRN